MNSFYSQILENKTVCTWCLERIVEPNSEKTIKQFIQDFNIIINENSCIYCKGYIMKSLEKEEKIVHILGEREFNSVRVGVKLPDQLENDLLFKKYGISVASIKQKISDVYYSRIRAKYQCITDIDPPDISIIIDLKRKIPRYEYYIKSLYYLGKYKKLKRGIPQTKWPCTVCKGKGCDACDRSGQQYPFSVELLVSKPFLELSGAQNSSFHGAGREDIDALMLGSGRPFVLELKNPKLRTFDITEVVQEINKSDMIQVTDMRKCTKSIIKKIKTSSSDARKVYHATVHVNCNLTEKQKNIISDLENKEIQLMQRTPQRVSHRRADKVRKKKIYSTKIIHIIDECNFVLEIEAQGGAYIKEYISGDENRTKPSISEILSNNAICTALDVISVDDKGIF